MRGGIDPPKITGRLIQAGKFKLLSPSLKKGVCLSLSIYLFSRNAPPELDRTYIKRKKKLSPMQFMLFRGRPLIILGGGMVQNEKKDCSESRRKKICPRGLRKKKFSRFKFLRSILPKKKIRSEGRRKNSFQMINSRPLS